MEPCIIKTKKGLPVLCKEIPTEKLSLEDYQVIHAAFNPHNTKDLCTQKGLEDFKLSLRITHSKCCQALLQSPTNELYATVGLVTYTEKSDHLYIRLLGIEPASQKQGIAGALIQYLEMHTKLPELRLHTEESKKHIYVKLGFEDCSSYMKKIKNTQTSL